MNSPLFFKPFGPTIYSNVISDITFALLNNATEVSIQLDVNVSTKLAGYIQKQLRLSLPENIAVIVEDEILSHLAIYLNMPFNDIKKKFFIPKNSMWINIQRPKEFNPPHHHDGYVSGVIYIDVPDEIVKEKQTTDNSTTFNQFGDITFYYGEGRMSENYFYLSPKSQQLLLFPAELKHGVFPFYSEVNRISIAFNIFEDNSHLN